MAYRASETPYCPGLPRPLKRRTTERDRPAPNRRVFIKSFGCQMNVYDSQRMADVAAAEGYRETADDRRRRPRRPQHLPYPRARLGKDLFRTRQDPRAEGSSAPARAETTTLVVAGCVAQAGGRRNPAPPARGRPRRRPAELSSPAATCCASARARRRRRHRISARGQVRPSARRVARGDRARAASAPSSPCRRAATSSARSASCPIRAARRVSRPVAKVLAEIERLAARGRARIHADRAERQRLSRRGARTAARSSLAELLAAAAQDSRRAAAALFHFASARHGRGSDPRPRRDRRAGALSAPAGAVGIGPNSGRDEPPPRRRATISTSSRACAARGPTSRSPRISSSAFPARPTPISRRRSRWCARSASPRPTRSNIRRGRARPAADADGQVDAAIKADAARPRCSNCSRRSARRSTARRSGDGSA